MRLQALRSKQRARLRRRAGLVYPRAGASIVPYTHHSYATSRTERSAANTPDRVTLTQRCELGLCKCWPRRCAALIERLQRASKQDLGRCCRGKLDVAWAMLC